MHDFLQEYGSLLMGLGVALCMFMAGMVSIWRDEARRARLADAKQNAQQGQDAAPVRH